MAWRSAASRSLLTAGRTASSAPRLRAAPLLSAPRRRIPVFSPSSPVTTARPLAVMMGSPAAVLARLTGHSASARACCELSQGTPFGRTCQDR